MKLLVLFYCVQQNEDSGYAIPSSSDSVEQPNVLSSAILSKEFWLRFLFWFGLVLLLRFRNNIGLRLRSRQGIGVMIC